MLANFDGKSSKRPLFLKIPAESGIWSILRSLLVKFQDSRLSDHVFENTYDKTTKKYLKFFKIL